MKDPISEEVVLESLELMLEPRNYPIMVYRPDSGQLFSFRYEVSHIGI
jgi:hypothetical protein